MTLEVTSECISISLFLFAPKVAYFNLRISPETVNRCPSQSLSGFLEQPTEDKPRGILRVTHTPTEEALIKVRPSRVDSELSDMSANTSPCKLPVTDPNLAVFNVSLKSSAGIPGLWGRLRQGGRARKPREKNSLKRKETTVGSLPVRLILTAKARGQRGVTGVSALWTTYALSYKHTGGHAHNMHAMVLRSMELHIKNMLVCSVWFSLTKKKELHVNNHG